MNNIPCQYAIVRFTPYIETEEFANVGIVLFAPRQKSFEFKLVTTRYGRITRFFHELEPRIYQASVKMLAQELTRVQKLLTQSSTASALDLFKHLIRPRETMLSFSPVRVVLASDLQAKLDELFGFYVERNFATQEYQEQALEKTLRSWLKEAGLAKQYRAEPVGDSNYHVTFPFVALNKTPTKVIKPLFLGQKELVNLIDHGAKWVTRIQQLKNRNCLPQQILFTFDEGENLTSNHQQECKSIRKQLEAENVQVVAHDNKQEILRFAV